MESISYMFSRIALVLFLVLQHLGFQYSEAQSWVRVGFWSPGIPISDINSALFTHLVCRYADLNSSSYEISISSKNNTDCSVFTAIVKQQNPSITTLLSIAIEDDTVYSSMVRNESSRRSFIQSSIRIARRYGFQGLNLVDLFWITAKTLSQADNTGRLLQEWRAAAKSEASDSSKAELILTACVYYSPDFIPTPSLVESIESNLNWIHVLTFGYSMPKFTNFTAAPSALYDPSSNASTAYGIRQWIGRGVSSTKLVLGLPFFGFSWNLTNPDNNSIGSPATGPDINKKFLGLMTYKEIRAHIQKFAGNVSYNDTYVVNYWSHGFTWIGFDDETSIKCKVLYAIENKLRGYFVSQVSWDDNWKLSIAAQQGSDDKINSTSPSPFLSPFVKVLLIALALSIILFVVIIHNLRRREMFKAKGMAKAGRYSSPKVNREAARPFYGNTSDLQVFSFSDIQEATGRFSIENMIGEGGYGTVYKGILPDGQEIAVKKRSKGSTQGYEEFKTEVTLASGLLHVNLVRLLGFSTDREEQMLVYEYMPNKSLDCYLFDSMKQHLLDWRHRVCIIEGVIQGLLYLQEYSRFTIIHRDLKASNILLDHEMKPKISDFGMARTFTKDKHEANTSKIVGTYGYIPPEYIEKGLYSIKSDMYSFGVLLLQIISGKKTSGLYGQNNDFNLLEYAYAMWKGGKGVEFVDSSLDDKSSPCKLMRCLQIALLCVQENAEDRPSMLDVTSMLRNESNCIAIPKKPAYSKTENEEEAICSQNDTTMSQILGR